MRMALGVLVGKGASDESECVSRFSLSVESSDPSLHPHSIDHLCLEDMVNGKRYLKGCPRFRKKPLRDEIIARRAREAKGSMLF
jgi:hypothetical protein